MPEEDYAQILPLYLADNAWDWYKYLPLDTQFSSHTEKWLVQTDLFSRRQKQATPSSEYVRWMVKKAFLLEFDDKVNMNLIVQDLLPTIKAFVISGAPISLDDVKQMAELAVAVSLREGSVHTCD